VLEVSAARGGDLDRLVALVAGLGSGPPVADVRAQRVTVPTRDGVATLLVAARRIEESRIPVSDLGLRRPSLDEVFLTLTGALTAPTPQTAMPGVPSPDQYPFPERQLA
jgi:hypothetical protein